MIPALRYYNSEAHALSSFIYTFFKSYTYPFIQQLQYVKHRFAHKFYTA